MAPHLEELGIRCCTSAYPSSRSELRALRGRLSDCDLVVIQKKLPSGWGALWWGSLERPLVFDFDDAIMFRQRPRRGSHRSRTRERRFRRAIALADGLLCGNRWLASCCGDARKPLLIAPSPVPTEVPRVTDRAPNRVLRVGWIGSRGNLADLARLGPVLRRVAAERDFHLVVISDQNLELDGVGVQNVRWTLHEQERHLSELDVGLMPLDAESPWARGKCAYKLLQYMAAEVAVVGSAVGMNSELIDPPRNGLLARSESEWVGSLLRLLGDADLRARLGRAGRSTVEEGFSYPVCARNWARFLKEVRAASD